MLRMMLQDLEKAKRKFNEEFEELKQDMGNTLKDNIQKNTPRDTGRLANSYKVEVNGEEVKVSSDVEYAPYVDLGHSAGSSFVPGKHMYDKGVNSLHTEADQIINEFFDKVKPF